MKYYKVEIQSIFPNEDRVLGHANGEFVTNGREYFDKIGNGKIIHNAPIFDYFHLQSFGDENDWEWRLQDVHRFIGVGSIMTGWYISDDLKLLLENFKIAPKYHFYETMLLFKEEKLKYWIFQFPIEPFKNINFQKSKFLLEDDNKIYMFSSEEEYLTFYRQEYRRTKRKLKILSQVLKSDYDLFLTTSNDKIIAENLKDAIETKGIRGFEFSELNYEIEINKN